MRRSAAWAIDYLDVYLLHWAGKVPIARKHRRPSRSWCAPARSGPSGLELRHPDLEQAERALSRERIACTRSSTDLPSAIVERKIIPGARRATSRWSATRLRVGSSINIFDRAGRRASPTLARRAFGDRHLAAQ